MNAEQSEKCGLLQAAKAPFREAPEGREGSAAK